MLRLIQGRAEKSKLFEDLCRGSSSGRKCWISYGQKINTTLSVDIDNYEIGRPDDTYEDKEKLYNDLKGVIEDFIKMYNLSYSDIYLYGNFSIHEINTLRDISEWMDEVKPDRIMTRLNCTIQNDNEDLIVKVIR